MKPCTVHQVLFWLMMATGLSSVPSFTSTRGTLHQPACLSCEAECSGSVKWTKIQKPSGDVEVARCDRISCSSEEGFIISHHQYMKGNLSLTVTAADYRRRGWYTCQCDGRDVCVVSLRIQTVEVVKQLRPGDPLVMDVLIPERVKITLHRSDDDDDDDGDDGVKSSVSVPLCTIEGRIVRCAAEFEKRVVFNSSLVLSAVNETDSGVYTLRDTDNDEIIANYTLTLTGNDTGANNDAVPAKGKVDSSDLQRIFNEELRGVVVGFCLGLSVFAVPWMVKGCMFIREKVKKRWSEDRDHDAPSVKTDPGEHLELHGGCGAKHKGSVPADYV